MNFTFERHKVNILIRQKGLPHINPDNLVISVLVSFESRYKRRLVEIVLQSYPVPRPRVENGRRFEVLVYLSTN